MSIESSVRSVILYKYFYNIYNYYNILECWLILEKAMIRYAITTNIYDSITNGKSFIVSGK